MDDFERRIDEVEAVFQDSLGKGIRCTCEDGYREQLHMLIYAQADARGESMDSIITPDPKPCEAKIHKGETGYVYPKIDPEPARARLVELVRDQGLELEPRIDLSPGWILQAGGFSESAWHENAEYPNRVWGEARPDPETYRKEIDEGDMTIKEIMSTQSDDPLQAAILERINKLRPVGIDPEDEDYDSEKWLEIGEEL